MKRAQQRILFHGLVVLLVGLLCGVPYGQAITHAWGEEAVRAWRLAHCGLVVTGIWLMVVAAVTPLLVLTTRWSRQGKPKTLGMGEIPGNGLLLPSG